MQRSKGKTSDRNKKETSASESGHKLSGPLPADLGDLSGEVNETIMVRTRGASSSANCTNNDDADNGSVKLDPKHTIQLQEQIKDVICSKPILDRLVALIADAVIDQVSQHVYAAINQDLETKNKEINAIIYWYHEVQLPEN